MIHPPFDSRRRDRSLPLVGQGRVCVSDEGSRMNDDCLFETDWFILLISCLVVSCMWTELDDQVHTPI